MLFVLILIVIVSTTNLMVFSETSQPSSWAKDAIESLRSTELYDDILFSNYQNDMNRLTFIKAVVRTYEIMQKREIEVDPTLSFVDTQDIDALKAYTIGLTTGVGNNRFAPLASLDRQTMTTFIIKLLKQAGIELAPPSRLLFNDDKNIPNWSKESIYISRANKFVSGYENNTFRADTVASTEVGLVLIHRMLFESLGKEFNVQGMKHVIELNMPEPFVQPITLDNDKTGTSVYINGELTTIKVELSNGYKLIPVVDLFKIIDKDNSKYSFSSNYITAKYSVDSNAYAFHYNRNYFYKNSAKLMFSNFKENNTAFLSALKTVSKDNKLYVPITLVLDSLNLKYEVKTDGIYITAPIKVVEPEKPSNLNMFGRLDLDIEKDDVSTSAGLKAFTNKYSLGDYATAKEIPTVYDIYDTSTNPNDPNYKDNPVPVWSKAEYDAFKKNPPELMGEDGSKPPYTSDTATFFRWILKHDAIMMPLSIDEPIISRNSSANIYLRGQVNMMGSGDNPWVVDNSKDIRVKYEIDVEIKTALLSPRGIVLLKMILRHYLGEQYVDSAYSLLLSNNAKERTPYQFGDKQLIISEIHWTGDKTFEIGNKGFKYNDYVAYLIKHGTANSLKPTKAENNPYHDYQLTDAEILKIIDAPGFNPWQ